MKVISWSQEDFAAIDRIQEARNLTRKGAVQFYTRQQKKAVSKSTAKLNKALDTQLVVMDKTPAKVKAHPLEIAAVREVNKAAKAAAKKSGTPVKVKAGSWASQNTEKCVRLFKAGKGIADIAEAMGDRNKQNRVRAALALAGSYEYKSATARRAVAKQIKAQAAKA